MDAALLSQYQDLIRALEEHPQDALVEGFDRPTLLRILKNLAVVLYVPTSVIDGDEAKFLERLTASVVSAKQIEAKAAPAMLEDIVKEWQAAKTQADASQKPLSQDKNFQNAQRRLDRLLEQQMGTHIANEISKEAEELTTHLFETAEENRNAIAAGIYNNKELDEVFSQIIPGNLPQEQQDQIRFALTQEAATGAMQAFSSLKEGSQEDLARILSQEIQNIAKREIGQELLVANPAAFTDVGKTHITNALNGAVANQGLEQIYAEGESTRHNAVSGTFLGNDQNAGVIGESLHADARELEHTKAFTARVREALEKEVSANPQFGTHPTDISQLVTRVYQDNQASFPSLAETYKALGERLASQHSRNVTRAARLSYLQKVRGMYPSSDIPPFSGTRIALLESQSLTNARLPWLQLAFPSRFTAVSLARTPASLLLGAGLSLGSRINPKLRDAWSLSLIGYETEQLKELKTFYENLQRQAASLTGYQRQLALQRSGGALLTIGTFEEFLKNPPAGTFLMRIFWRLAYLQKDAKFIENFINAQAAPRYIEEGRKKLRAATEEKAGKHKGRALHELEFYPHKESDPQAPSRGFLNRLKTRTLPKLWRRYINTDKRIREKIKEELLEYAGREAERAKEKVKEKIKKAIWEFIRTTGRKLYEFTRWLFRGVARFLQKVILPLLQRFLPFLANMARAVLGGIARGALALVRGFLTGLSLASRGVIALVATPYGWVVLVIALIIGIAAYLIFFVAPFEAPTPIAIGGDISNCTFYRGGDSVEGRKIGNPQMAALISDISGKVGLPAAIVAAVMRVETVSAMISADATYLTNDYDAHFSKDDAGNPVAYGVMQFTPGTFTSYFTSNKGEMTNLFGKTDVTTDIAPFESKHPENILRMYSVKDSIIAAAFKIKTDKKGINGDGPWDEETIKKIAARYYGTNADGSTNYPGFDGSTQNYGNDLWKSYKNCTVASTAPPIAASSCPLNIPSPVIGCGSFMSAPQFNRFACAGPEPIDRGHSGRTYGGYAGSIEATNNKRRAHSIDVDAPAGEKVYLPTIDGQSVQWIYSPALGYGVAEKDGGGNAHVFIAHIGKDRWILHLVHMDPPPVLPPPDGRSNYQSGDAVTTVAPTKYTHLHINIGKNPTSYDGGSGWLNPEELGMCVK